MIGSLEDFAKSVDNLSDEALRAYNFRYIAFDDYLDRLSRRRCDPYDCPYIKNEPDIGYSDCKVGGDLLDIDCYAWCEVSTALRIAIACDLFMRDLLG